MDSSRHRLSVLPGLFFQNKPQDILVYYMRSSFCYILILCQTQLALHPLFMPFMR